ncbi:MAG: M48 family metallopeptidase [Clostridiales Family XIII bacterium]|jgi:predicted metal-dependent hydrolase|nr:M48 family metallopeptidase [Clostridiales Family XIII bacterium]
MENDLMEYRLTRSRRRTITIRVTKDAVLDVRAPMRTSVREIEGFLRSKQKWIDRHMKEARDAAKSRAEFSVSPAVVKQLRDKAKAVLTERTEHYAELMGVRPASVRVGSAKSRWGSCSSAGRINYAWYIIMGDDELIDYLVVHELTHLTHMNHSKRFWDAVGIYIPDAKSCRKRLRELQTKLNAEGW